MVLMNYHELTMQEARDSPARRQQFLVICTVMAAVFLYSSTTSGVFSSVVIDEAGLFPGNGLFVYKTSKRDYAAAPSMLEHIARDMKITSKKDPQNDQMYTIYLDDPAQIDNGRDHRFACGYLARTENEQEQALGVLQTMNDKNSPPTRTMLLELPASDLWPKLRYKQQEIPSQVAAAVAHFPFTNGFVSSLVFNFKILPKLRAAAERLQRQAGNEKAAVTIVSSCSIPDSMCTHYAPLDNTDIFLLGQAPMEEYILTLPKTETTFGIDWKEIRRTVKTQLPTGISNMIFGKDEAAATPSEPQKDEL